MPAAHKQFLQSCTGVLVIVNEQNFQTLLRSFTAYFARHDSYFSGRKCLHRQDECRPRSRPSLCAVRVPLCACARDFEIARPRPSPPNRRSNERLPCSKGSKMRCITSGSMPIPVSRMVIVKTSGDGLEEEIAISPSSGVNLTAFLSRFQMIC